MNRGQVLLPGEAELAGELLKTGDGSSYLERQNWQENCLTRGQVLLPGEAELAGELLDLAVHGQLVLLETVGRLEGVLALLTGVGPLTSVVHDVTL